ncbi:MAG: ribosome maturation factor RimM [Anaerotardibacter sp.]
MSAWVNVAKLTKEKTLEGGLLAHSVQGLPFLLTVGLEVAFVPPIINFPRYATVCQVDHKGNDNYLVYFEEIDSIDMAEKLVGHYCLVRKADLPEGWDANPLDLYTSFTVENQDGMVLGHVLRIEENPAHPLLVVSYEEKEILIPLVEELLIDINEDAQRIIMQIPQGLLEL